MFKKNRFQRPLGSAVLPFLVATMAHAQNATDGVVEQRRAEERERALRQRMEQTPNVRLPREAPSAVQAPVSENPCFPIQRIEMDGQDASRFAWALPAAPGLPDDPSPYGCLGALGIQALIDQIQHRLIEKGYVTTRVLAGSQDLKSGRLVLTVFAGRIGAIDHPADAGVSLRNTMPGRPGDLLNLRDVEQGLENLQRLQSLQAEFEILPADQPGLSVLAVRTKQEKPWHLSLAADNGGSRATGRYQSSGTLSLDNPLGVADFAYVTLNYSLAAPAGSKNAGGIVHYAVPWRYWMLSATHSRQRYHQAVAGAVQTYDYNGISSQSEVKASWLVHRDAARKTTLGLRLWRRASANYIDDTEVEVQRRTTGGYELGLTHRELAGNATLDSQLLVRRGTGAFGAIAAPEELFGEGASRVQIAQAQVNLSMPFTLGPLRLRYNGEWRAQRARNRLTAPDRFSIGGRYTVRGFDGESVLSADRGWYLRNEISSPLGSSGLEGYLGVDGGSVGGYGSDVLAGRRLVGGVIGVRGAPWRNFTIDVMVGAPLHKPEAMRAARANAAFQLTLLL